MENQFKDSCSYVTKLLAQYPRTVFEIKNKLVKKEYEEEIINETIKFFIEHKLLSDEEYAKLFLENQIKYRPTGRIMCRNKMIKKGLDRDLVERTLSEDFSQSEEEGLAYKLAKSKEIFFRNKTKKEKFAKIGQYLNRKGFSENIIWQTLEELNLLN
ncbi:MAG: RecX family transcriptional regulator [Parcubacteria group bacterium]|nr:RecX family transcriptional regulator [Parcubacteria group bacterium]